MNVLMIPRLAIRALRQNVLRIELTMLGMKHTPRQFAVVSAEAVYIAEESADTSHSV